VDWKPAPKSIRTGQSISKRNGFTLVELMVVVVIVGILAAVAIPKFLDASNKAKASEFPTQLAAIYTGEMAYNAENGTYCASFVTLRSAGCVDIASTSKWFNYTVTSASPNTAFNGTAKVAAAFGVTAVNDTAGIDQTNTKTASSSLQKYVSTWK
jgi:type IV pilus assembly protein PilA